MLSADALRVGGSAVDRAYLSGEVVYEPSLYRVLTVDNAAGGAKNDWPVKVSLTSGNFNFTEAEADGSDVRFSSGATVIPHWIQDWDPTSQTASIWVKVPSLSAGGTAQVRMRYGDGATATQDPHAVFPDLFEDFSSPDDVMGPLDQIPAPQLGNWNRFPQIAAGGEATWRSTNLREVSRIIHDPDDPNPARRYKMYLTGWDGANNKIGAWFSPDAQTWTEHPTNPILADDLDDLCWVRIDASTVYVYCESPGMPGIDGIRIRRYTSTDNGLTFTNNGITIPLGTAGSWDESRMGSPSIVRAANGVYVMMYDGAATNGGLQKCGAATSTDGITWTRVGADPLIGLIGGQGVVPLDLWQAENGSWYCLAWAAERTYLYRTTQADPTLWTPAGWSDVGATSPLFVTTGTLALAENFGRREGVYETIGDATPANNVARRVGFLGNDRVTFSRFPTGAHQPISSLIEAYDGQLQLVPAATAAIKFSLTARFAASLTNGWAVGVRMRKEAAPTESFTRLSVGDGATVAASGNDQWAAPSNAYSLIFGTNAGTDTTVNRITAGTQSALGSAFAVADFANYHKFEMRHVGTSLSVARDGAVLATRAESSHDALAKDVMLTQGHSSPATGARSWWTDIYARPFDGVDPAVTVGPVA